MRLSQNECHNCSRAARRRKACNTPLHGAGFTPVRRGTEKRAGVNPNTVDLRTGTSCAKGATMKPTEKYVDRASFPRDKHVRRVSHRNVDALQKNLPGETHYGTAVASKYHAKVTTFATRFLKLFLRLSTPPKSSPLKTSLETENSLSPSSSSSYSRWLPAERPEVST